MKLHSGAYDTLITQAVEDALTRTDLISTTNDVKSADAAEKYSRLIASVVHRAVTALPERVRVSARAYLVNELIDHFDARLPKSRMTEDLVT